MATDKPRFSVSMSEDMLQRVEQYRKEHQIATKSKAVMQLAEIGLESIKKEALPIQGKANEIMNMYDSLDAHGQRMVEIVAAEEQARQNNATYSATKKSAQPVLRVSAESSPIAAYGPVQKDISDENKQDIKNFLHEASERQKEKNRL